MQYNLKIKEFANDISVNFYSTHVRRKEESEKNDKGTNKNRKQHIRDNIQNTWNNPKTGKVEIIPEGFRVTYNPFEKCEYLFPEDRFLTEDVFYGMDFEELLPIVQKGLQEERMLKDFSNSMRSLRRTKQNIYTIARGSCWDLFVTLTIADNELRNDLDKAKKHVGDYILNQSLQQLRKIGAVRVNIDWTILKDFYGQFGFKAERLYLAAYKEFDKWLDENK